MTKPKQVSEGYRADIDGLRAIAILAVITYHAFPEHIRGGYVGVDIFFVISGFLISRIILTNLYRGSFSLLGFYARRVRRIFPALATVMIASLLYGWLNLLPDEFKLLGQHVFAGAGFFSNFLLLSEAGYFDKASELKPMLHLWSLAIEEQFYLLWPIILCISSRRKWSVPLIIGGIAFISFALTIAGTNSYQVETFFWPITRFWELLMGSFLGYFMLHPRGDSKDSDDGASNSSKMIRTNLQSVIGAVLILTACFSFNTTQAFPSWRAVLPTLGAFLIIRAGPQSWLNKNVLSQPSMVYIGLISFPLYLWHWPIITFIRMFHFGNLPWQSAVLALFLSVLLAALTYRYIEQSIQGQSEFKVGGYLICIMLLIGGGGYFTFAANGFPSRYSNFIANISRYTLDSKEIAEAWRRNKCMLEVNEFIFADECKEELTGRPSMLLWGDSHAAALYPGIRALALEHSLALTQFNASRCPPIVGYDTDDPLIINKGCSKVNNFVFSYLSSHQFDLAILTAFWERYDFSQLAASLRLMKLAGVQRIILVGSVPVWTVPLRDLIVSTFNSDPLHRIQKRLSKCDTKVAQEIDNKLQAIAKSEGVEFISARELLADDTGCLAIAGEADLYSSYADFDHLTPMAAEYLIRKSGIFGK